MQNRPSLRLLLLGGFAIVAAALIVHFWPSMPSASPSASKVEARSIRTPTTSDSDAELRITVQTETATAIATASVSLSQIKTGSAWWQQPPTATQETTPDGVSSFALQPGQYQLSVNAPGYLPHTERVRMATDDESISIQLFAGGHVISGIVKDSGGGIIAGAVVTLTSTANDGPSNTPIRATTDIDGVYRSSAPAGVYKSQATADGYVSQASLVQLPPSREHHDFSLFPAAVAEGHVVYCSSGAPAEGMEIATSQSQAVGPGAEQKLTYSDATGAFRFEGLSFGEHKVSARGDGLASFSGATISLGLGETVSTVELCVSKAYSVSGHVRRPDGSSIAGAVIDTAAISNRINVQPAVSDKLGKFRIEGLVPGEYGLHATTPTNPESTTVRVSISNSDLGEVELTVLNGISVTGRVDPPQKASIQIRPQNPNPQISQAVRIFRTGLLVVDQTTDDGLFTLANLPPGAWTIVATGSNGTLGEENILAEFANIDDVTVHMEEQASLKGRVVTESGTPVRSARVIMVNSDTTFL